MTKHYTEEYFKYLILNYLIPSIDTENKISIKSIKVEGNVYDLLLDLLSDSKVIFYDNTNRWDINSDIICEISINNQKLNVKNSKKHLDSLNETSKLFTNKYINIIVCEGFFQIPRFDVKVIYRNSKSTLFIPTGGFLNPLPTKQFWGLRGYVRDIYKLFKEAVRRIKGSSNTDKFRKSEIKGIDANLFLFFVQEDDNKITWYSTIYGSFYYTKKEDGLHYNLLVNNGLLHIFLKPVNLSDYDGEGVENLNILISALLI
jgi:hypothetical protein